LSRKTRINHQDQYLVQNGQQVFVISWRNPDARHSGWGLDTYVSAVLEALDGIADHITPWQNCYRRPPHQPV
jgi:poly(3-hydroxyalkanoate) synthetase